MKRSSRPIKVVHIANFDIGLRIHLGNYLRYQREQGYTVSAITNPGEWLYRDSIIHDGIFVKILPFKPRMSPLTDITTLFRLWAYFRQEQFDIVHTHTVKPGLLGRLAAKLANVPVILHTIHGFYFYEGMQPTQYRIFVNIEKLGAECCHLLLSQNIQDIETAIREKICSSDKILHLGNGIDLNRFNPKNVSFKKVMALRDQFGIQPQMPIIGFIARLEREKGIFEFFEAVQILNSTGINARYLVIGNPPKNKQSAVSPLELIQSFGINESVIILGHRDDIPELLALMDIVVLPSYGREGIPRIIMESAAMAKPVVATRVRGITEAVEDGETGILIPPQDGCALAAGIQYLLENPESASEIGRKAHLRALQHFDEKYFFWKTDVEYRRLFEENLGIDISSTLAPIPDSADRVYEFNR